MGLKERYQSLIHTLKYTAVETAIFLVVGAVAGGLIADHHQRFKARTIPLAFSEVTQQLKEKRQLSEIQIYLMGLNDTLNKIWECYNKANEGFSLDPRESFARELEARIDPAYTFHTHPLRELLAKNGFVETHSQEALRELKPWVVVRNKTAPNNDTLGRVWDDSHHDVTHTETRTRTVTHTDSQGHTYTTTETYTVTVYDYTIHTYNYHRQEGEAASKALEELVSEKIVLRPPKMRMTRSVGAENAYAIEKSHHLEDRSKVEVRILSNNWFNGSTIRRALNDATSLYSRFPQNAISLKAATRTAHSERYRTYHHSDPGPAEFRTMNGVRSDGRAFVKNVDRMTNSIHEALNALPRLRDLITDLIRVELDKKKPLHSKSGRDAEKKLLRVTRDLYRSNFAYGYKIDPYSLWAVILSTLGGGLLGAGFGKAVDELTTRFQIYDHLSLGDLSESPWNEMPAFKRRDKSS